MRSYQYVLLGTAVLAISACGGAEQKANNSANAAAANQAAAPTVAPPVSEAPAGNNAQNRVETMQRTTSNGNRIETRELVGPDVQAPGSRPMNMDEIQEIEKATGRPYQEGDSIHGRAKEVK